MNPTFEPVDGDDDVLLLNKDTFTVSRFKELVHQEIRTKLLTEIINKNNTYLYSTHFWTISIGREAKLVFKDIQFYNLSVNCQILKIGSQGWQKGKLRTKVLTNLDGLKIEVCLEFCPDEPTVTESPLDDLRQLPEYKQQS